MELRIKKRDEPEWGSEPAMGPEKQGTEILDLNSRHQHNQQDHASNETTAA